MCDPKDLCDFIDDCLWLFYLLITSMRNNTVERGKQKFYLNMRNTRHEYMWISWRNAKISFILILRLYSDFYSSLFRSYVFEVLFERRGKARLYSSGIFWKNLMLFIYLFSAPVPKDKTQSVLIQLASPNSTSFLSTAWPLRSATIFCRNSASKSTKDVLISVTPNHSST
jgi:hypothetical protein